LAELSFLEVDSAGICCIATQGYGDAATQNKQYAEAPEYGIDGPTRWHEFP
jgi:hypothetical protein